VGRRATRLISHLQCHRPRIWCEVSRVWWDVGCDSAGNNYGVAGKVSVIAVLGHGLQSD
jgi:hypothetical protein